MWGEVKPIGITHFLDDSEGAGCLVCKLSIRPVKVPVFSRNHHGVSYFENLVSTVAVSLSFLSILGPLHMFSS
jgi:hypothetical protein